MITKYDEMLCHQIVSTFDHVLDSGGIGYAYDDPRPELKLVGMEHDYQFLSGTRQLKSGRIVYTAANGSKIEIFVRALTHLT